MLKVTQTRKCFGASDQIDICKDEEVEEVMADVNGWTKVKNKGGDVGLVPTKLLGNILQLFLYILIYKNIQFPHQKEQIRRR